MVNTAASLFRAVYPPPNHLKRQHFTFGKIRISSYDERLDTEIRGRDRMFEQTVSGTLRNLAIGLVLTAAVVGAGFALAFA